MNIPFQNYPMHFWLSTPPRNLQALGVAVLLDLLDPPLNCCCHSAWVTRLPNPICNNGIKRVCLDILNTNKQTHARTHARTRTHTTLTIGYGSIYLIKLRVDLVLLYRTVQVQLLFHQSWVGLQFRQTQILFSVFLVMLT